MAINEEPCVTEKRSLNLENNSTGPNPFLPVWALGRLRAPLKPQFFPVWRDKYIYLFSLRGLKPNQSYFNVDVIKNYKMLSDTIFEVTLKEYREVSCRWETWAPLAYLTHQDLLERTSSPMDKLFPFLEVSCNHLQPHPSWLNRIQGCYSVFSFHC